MLKVEVMKSVFVGAVFGLLCFLAVSCSQNRFSEKCRFEYSETLKKEIVSPLLKQEVGDLFPYFNIDKPAVVASKGNAKIILSPSNRVDGMFAMSEDSYVFVFDSCSNELVEHYKVVRN
jgi:hypothetical protein